MLGFQSIRISSLQDDLQELEQIAGLLCMLLHESPRVARKIAINWQANKEYYERAHTESNGSLGVCATPTDFPMVDPYRRDIDRLKHYVSLKQRHLLFLTFHYGDYLSTIQNIVHLMNLRRAAVIHQKQGIDHVALFASKFPSSHQLKVLEVDGPQQMSSAISQLHEVDAVFAFFDEPATRFDGHATFLFDKRVRWTKAYLAMANALESLVVPYVSEPTSFGYTPAFQETICFLQPNDYQQAKETSERLVRIAEQHIRAAPEEWHYWSRLGHMLADE
ncbi:MAG: hypothetical protein AAF431_19835 [Pseudomonadota bacterium]